MSYFFQNCAGTVHAFTNGVTGGSGIGLFKLRPAIPTTAGTACFIDSIPADFREVVQPIVTLDDKRFIYAFGSSWAESSISGRLLLGKMGNGGALTRSLVEWYSRNRISVLRGPISASAGSMPLKAYVTGMRIGETDPSLHIQSFSISALVDFEVSKFP